MTAAKIKQGAVTGAKIKLGTLGTVPTAAAATNAAQVGGVPASGYVRNVVEPVHYLGTPGETALEDGCKPIGEAFENPGFFKDLSGIVHLVGDFKDCEDNGKAFTLPPGFRPARDVDYYFDEGLLVFIEANGAVFLEGQFPVMNGVTFRAAG